VPGSAQVGQQVLLLGPGEVGPAATRLHPGPLQQVLPEAAAELGPGAPVGQQTPGLGRAALLKTDLEIRSTAAATPVDLEGGPVAAGLQVAGSKGGEPQGGRSGPSG
jgi:hypothetical protein